MSNNSFRSNEYTVLFYRIFLVFLFYQVSRVLFYCFNSDIIQINSITELFKLCWYGTAFDTTAILYINSLFILLSVLPFTINTKPGYQKGIRAFYFITNLFFLATNFVDFAYYKFSQTRSNKSTLDLLKNESNGFSLLSHFLATYWLIFVIFIALVFVWIYLYNLVKVKPKLSVKPLIYFPSSVAGLLVIATLSVGGIRGDFKHSTRPINMVDAYRHVTVPNHGDVVLNTPFSIFRTWNIKKYEVKNWVSEEYITENIKPIKFYKNETVQEKPNIVIFILESFGREYWGCMNRNTAIPNFQSHTPFLDSLSQSSLIFTNAYANGRQSIHGMSSVLAGIPSFQDAFTSSPYAKQEIQSIVSICDSMGYNTSFFHGAANGSMGFLGFSNILGYKSYLGKTEYNNDEDHDGIWGIWDEPFFQFMGKTLSQEKAPFMATVFSVSSHDPYKVPSQYKNKFKEGDIPIHKCIEYSDYSIKRFMEYAKTQSWYNNTIFVFTADHTNQNYYDAYNNTINRFAVPIMFFSPNEEYGLKGIREDLAQQIDIYPTLVELIGYNKPFRSWGRSLKANLPDETPRAINSPGNVYQFIQDNYIYIFDGTNFTGIYDIQDKELKTNLLKENNEKMKKGMKDCKAFVQDYAYRITQRKLN